MTLKSYDSPLSGQRNDRHSPTSPRWHTGQHMPPIFFMNAPRRKAIADLISDLEEIADRIEAIKDEEQDYLDNMPESLQSGEKGEAAESAVSALENAKDSADGAAIYLGDIE